MNSHESTSLHYFIKYKYKDDECNQKVVDSNILDVMIKAGADVSLSDM